MYFAIFFNTIPTCPIYFFFTKDLKIGVMIPDINQLASDFFKLQLGHSNCPFATVVRPPLE